MSSDGKIAVIAEWPACKLWVIDRGWCGDCAGYSRKVSAEIEKLKAMAKMKQDREELNKVMDLFAEQTQTSVTVTVRPAVPAKPKAKPDAKVRQPRP